VTLYLLVRDTSAYSLLEFLIYAETEQDARLIASESDDTEEQGEKWLDHEAASCREVRLERGLIHSSHVDGSGCC